MTKSWRALAESDRILTMTAISSRKKKTILMISGSLFLALAAFGVVHFSTCTIAQAQACPAQVSTTESPTSLELAPRYYQYTDSTLQKAQQQGKVVLYFWAPWCSTCTSLDIELQKNQIGIPEGITVLRIEYDNSADLKNKYQVITQHTFVQIDSQGNMVTSWVGGDIDNFSRYIR